MNSIPVKYDLVSTEFLEEAEKNELFYRRVRNILLPLCVVAYIICGLNYHASWAFTAVFASTLLGCSSYYEHLITKKNVRFLETYASKEIVANDLYDNLKLMSEDYFELRTEYEKILSSYSGKKNKKSECLKN